MKNKIMNKLISSATVKMGFFIVLVGITSQVHAEYYLAPCLPERIVYECEYWPPCFYPVYETHRIHIHSVSPKRHHDQKGYGEIQEYQWIDP